MHVPFMKAVAAFKYNPNYYDVINKIINMLNHTKNIGIVIIIYFQEVCFYGFKYTTWREIN